MIDSKTRFAVVILMSLAVGLPAMAAEPCRIERKGQAPLTESLGRFTTLVLIDNEPLAMLVDTGAQRAFLSPAAGDRLKLPYDMSRSFRSNGIGGRGGAEHPRLAGQIRFGGVTWPGYPIQISPIAGPEQAAVADAPFFPSRFVAWIKNYKLDRNRTWDRE